MKYRAFILCLFFVPSLLAAQQRSFPNTKNGVFVFHDQLPGSLTDAQWQFAATHLIGCQKMIKNHVDKLRSYNSNFIVVNYKLALGQSAVNNNGDSIRYIYGNNWVTNWWWVTQQTNWFILTQGTQQRLLQPDWFWYLMDVSGRVNNVANGWKEHWLSTCIDEIGSTGADGVFADSFDGSLLNTDMNYPQLTPYDARLDGPNLLSFWPPHLNVFASYVKNGLDNHNPKYYFLPNFGGMITTWDTIDYARYTHGGMVEGFAQWSAGNYFALGDWKLQMNRTLGITNRGKILLLEPNTAANNFSNRMYLMGCYFLVKGEKTFITMLGTGGLNLEWYPEYTINLGAYQGNVPTNIDQLFNASWGVYRRDYANGFVLVNPTNNPVTINSLGGTYHRVTASGGGLVNQQGQASGSLNSSSVTSVTVPAYGAVILLNQPVPVELSSFTVMNAENVVQLDWTTASETNNAGFRIEHRTSSDKNSFWEKIGYISGNGTSTTEKRYHFLHTPTTGGIHRYRLCQIDFDGTENFSQEISLDLSEQKAPDFDIEQIAPNPASPPSSIIVQYRAARAEEIRIDIVDMLGREVRTIFHGLASAGKQEAIFHIDGLHTGVYQIRLRGSRFSDIRKFIIR